MSLGIFFSVVEQVRVCFAGQIQRIRKAKLSDKKRSCRLIKIPSVPTKIKGVFSSKSSPLTSRKAPLRNRLIKDGFVQQILTPFEEDPQEEGPTHLTLAERMASSQQLHAHLVVSKCLEQANVATTPADCSSYRMVPIIKEQKELSVDWTVPREEERQFQIIRPNL